MSVSLDPYVLELMASRMCHDIISPVGAISNGIELMEELGPDGLDDAKELIGKSAEQANRRLRVFRYCYGTAGSKEQIDTKDLRKTAFDFFEGGRAVLEWSENAIDNADELPRGFLKSVLNLVLLGGEMITKAGVIKIRQEGLAVTIAISGENAAFREGMEAALSGTINPQDLDARLIHAYITGQLLRFFALKLDIDKPSEGKTIFTVSAK